MGKLEAIHVDSLYILFIKVKESLISFLQIFLHFSPLDVDKVVLALRGGGVGKPATGVSSSDKGFWINQNSFINLLDLFVSLSFGPLPWSMLLCGLSSCISQTSSYQKVCLCQSMQLCLFFLSPIRKGLAITMEAGYSCRLAGTTVLPEKSFSFLARRSFLKFYLWVCGQSSRLCSLPSQATSLRPNRWPFSTRPYLESWHHILVA